ncbi:DNA mismatch repair endonuclease MutL [Desulfitobacterium chlororespirans]|uniref:DNA mismatch repair protein MutL n=1 Tax=Desulfitobacterium chlororespirans DSM 11544 TaxID=1121395 RepID=A0A1M7UMN7_9FIRM|nr:DNA mismatch repair endonuclease MutL [Desulfitobacterium chlororespirans]SHN84155.1 DNA mismatch repair protein MutL [Desulfitobacterium chlororespirans DSM 11544]
MTAKIHILDIQAANQIAAGEVVERPVSVVKELIENALDAQATQIEVIIEGSGVERIRVQDNGQGISAEDLPLTVLRHATSKIRTIDDLNRLRTLGFRGEALPSIASVSRLEIISRPPEEISGRVLRIQGGEQLEFSETGCPPGTTITVDDLFYNTPARRKFLKSKNTEFGQISDLIGRLSLARPDVSFTLKHPKILVLQTPGKGNLLESIGAVLGQATARRLLPLSCSLGDWQLEGYISPPDLVRSTKQGETLIVNERIIRSNSISRAISEGYHTLIPAKLYPITILKLHIPPHEYDVNVHPTKMEIRFHKEKELMEFIAEGVRRTLLQARPIAPFVKVKNSPSYKESLPSGDNGDRPVQAALNFASKSPHSPSQGKTIPIPYKHSNLPPLGLVKGLSASQRDYELNADNEFKTGHELKAHEFAGTAKLPIKNLNPQEARPVSEHKIFLESQEPFQVTPLKADTLEPNLSLEPILSLESDIFSGSDTFGRADAHLEEEEVGAGSTAELELSVAEENYEITDEIKEQSPLLALRPVGQVFNTYILAAEGDQLVIFDQHAAHERINYERLLAEHQKNPGNSQMLLIPLTMEFTPGEEEALLEHFLLLNDMGFILEHFGTRTYLLRGIPAYSGPYQGEHLLRDFLDQVMLNHIPPTMDKLLEEWIYMLACKASIKAKENLTLFEMEQLIVQLSKTLNPYTCPHGRPTMIQLTKEELEHRFYRS